MFTFLLKSWSNICNAGLEVRERATEFSDCDNLMFTYNFNNFSFQRNSMNLIKIIVFLVAFRCWSWWHDELLLVSRL